MNNETLKPCPFCGSKAKMNVKDFARHFLYVVECTNDCCPASYMIGATYDSSEEATLYWNRRVTDEQTQL